MSSTPNIETAPPAHAHVGHGWRWVEFLGLFGGGPLLVLAVEQRWVLAVILWVAALVAYRFNRRVHRATAGRLHLKANLWRVLARAVAISAFLAIMTWWLLPDAFLALPRTHPLFWLVIMVAYPLLSVWPQEILYRAFLYYRYAPIFGTGRGYVAASAAAFGFAHVIFLNWPAVVMTVAGGFLFARDYARHRSLTLVCLEHALYGCVIFTVGLGRFFFTGAAWH